jgi:hypothetical protein
MIMDSNIKSVLTFGVGFVGGWAARSLSDSPQGVGVKLLEIAMNAKERVSRWAALEGERLEDMLAEARSKVEPDISGPKRATNGSAHEARTTNEEA